MMPALSHHEWIRARNFAGLSAGFQSAHPFPHIVLDDFFQVETAERLATEFPEDDNPFWYSYDNPLERKLACNRFECFPESIGEALRVLNAPETVEVFSQLSGIGGLSSDPGLHGGGMHCTRRGGKLDVHLDYSIHPLLGLERRLNLIVYLNRQWEEDWGGQLEFWEQDMSGCAVRVTPMFNRAVLFSTGDSSYHGHPEPLNCPEGSTRKSLAVYYLTQPRTGASQRARARFVARPQDPQNEEIERFRELRSGLTTGPSVYRAQTPPAE
jgi:hypothetical protein